MKLVKLIGNSSECESKWTNWPIVIGGRERFSEGFSLIPLKTFTDAQVADIEIVWSRLNDKKGDKTICSIPISMLSATEPQVKFSFNVPLKALILREFPQP